MCGAFSSPRRSLAPSACSGKVPADRRRPPSPGRASSGHRRRDPHPRPFRSRRNGSSSSGRVRDPAARASTRRAAGAASVPVRARACAGRLPVPLSAGGADSGPHGRARRVGGQGGGGGPRIHHGAVVDVPGRPIALWTPGHTDGHCGFWFEDAGVLMTGDAIVTLDPYTGETGPRIVAGAATAESDRPRPAGRSPLKRERRPRPRLVAAVCRGQARAARPSLLGTRGSRETKIPRSTMPTARPRCSQLSASFTGMKLSCVLPTANRP